jgi:hypothetical protein
MTMPHLISAVSKKGAPTATLLLMKGQDPGRCSAALLVLMPLCVGNYQRLVSVKKYLDLPKLSTCTRTSRPNGQIHGVCASNKP